MPVLLYRSQTGGHPAATAPVRVVLHDAGIANNIHKPLFVDYLGDHNSGEKTVGGLDIVKLDLFIYPSGIEPILDVIARAGNRRFMLNLRPNEETPVIPMETMSIMYCVKA